MTMTLYRPHRGLLAAAMAEVEPCRNLEELRAILARAGDTLVEVKPYGPDPRIGWDTHIVIASNPGQEKSFPAGFVNGPPE